MGRPQKPTVLKVLEGNPGKRPLPKAEPKIVGEVERPKWLRGRSVEVWDQYAPILQRIGLLTIGDVDDFARWCCLTAEHRKNPPKFSVSKHARLDALSGKFGLTPADRARIFGRAGAPLVTPSSSSKQAKPNPFKELTG